MKLLVTGATGFIGRHVVRDAMARAHDVTAFVRPSSADRAPAGARVVAGELDDAIALGTALQDVDAVIHCAASLAGGAEEQRAITVGGTESLVAALRSSGCRRVVGVGTFANYDVSSVPVGGVVDERCPLVVDFSHRHPYLEAKAEQERLLASLRDEGFVVHLLRPGLVHGEGRRWFHHLGARLGPAWLLFSPGGLLPLVSVENCARALVDASEQSEQGAPIANVLDAELPTRRDYAARIASEEGARPVIVGVPWWMVSLPARLLSPLANLLPLPDIARLGPLSERCKPVRYSDAVSE